MPFTRVPLSDNAGEIIAVGPGVDAVVVGDRVTMTHYWQWFDGDWHASMAEKDYSATIDGFLAEQVVVPSAALIKLPDPMSFEQASTLQSAGLTAWNAVIEAGAAKESDTVLTLGTGGVSMLAMQLAKMRGARVIVTSSSDEKLKVIKALGADHTVNYRENPDWPVEVLDLTDGEGADVIVNNVGIGELENCLLAASSNGRLMYVGANPVVHNLNQQAPVTADRLPNLILKSVNIHGIIVGSRRMFVDLIRAIVRHGIEPIIDRVFDWDEIYDVIDHMESGKKIGKIVIRVT